MSKPSGVNKIIVEKTVNNLFVNIGSTFVAYANEYSQQQREEAFSNQERPQTDVVHSDLHVESE